MKHSPNIFDRHENLSLSLNLSLRPPYSHPPLTPDPIFSVPEPLPLYHLPRPATLFATQLLPLLEKSWSSSRLCETFTGQIWD